MSPSLSLQVPSAPHPSPGDALQQRHEIGGVLGEEGWQGLGPPHTAVLPWGSGKGQPECGFPGRVQSCQIQGKSQA